MVNTDFAYKMCIFGDEGVGKSCLTHRYLTGSFDLNAKKTLGATINIKHINVENIKVIIQIWDFGGEDKFRFLLPAYVYGSSAGIFMYDVTRKDTLKKINDWLTSFKEGLKSEKQEIPIFMVGGKMDLIEQKSVSINDSKMLTQPHKFLDYFECSAKTGENVERIFEKITRIVLRKAGMI